MMLPYSIWMLISGLITMIAAVHYFYMRGVWIETGTSPTQFRYIDWVLTVPLMCVEFYLILKAFGGRLEVLVASPQKKTGREFAR